MMKKLLILPTIIFLLIHYECFSQKLTLTFNVDMNGLGFGANDTALNVRVKGDVEPLNWTSGIVMSDTDNDGIYSASITFDSKNGKELTYKYVLNNVEWEMGDNLKTFINPLNKNLRSKFRYNKRAGNPFQKFIGEWSLKNDNWVQGYNNNTDTVKIPDHHTVCKEINTDNSLLWIVEAPNSKGHIFWSFNSSEKSIQWSSSFYSYRSGVGNGTFSNTGDLTFKVVFEGDPTGAYGIYTYHWVSDNEFVLKSVQYDNNGKPTGGSYGGTFLRIAQAKKSKIIYFGN